VTGDTNFGRRVMGSQEELDYIERPLKGD